MKIVTIIGARPQFIKAAAVSRAIAAHNRQTLNLDLGTSNIELRTLNFEHSSSVEPRTLNIEHSTLNEILIHTGQHYDDGMSAVFFRELEIPEPKYNLAIGSGSHGAQTGQMLTAIEKVLIEEKPDWVLIYGDTNSTLAGALAAAKLHIPIAHVEAGISFLPCCSVPARSPLTTSPPRVLGGMPWFDRLTMTLFLVPLWRG